ncbi:LLM class flavin-dependent oxidoreductase [Candidatus Thorarchaeota archaeon]|nr:MAG: LLM class flavin-dependent oxidoreductase [Candidatus Thorarchaeota archaeon]
MYKLSIGMTTNMKTSATQWLAGNADRLGAHRIWIGEDIGLGQDIFVLTAATLLESDRVQVGTGITPISVHNLTTLARAGMTLQQISNDRFIFGTGIGGLQDLERRGIEIEKPVTVLREGVKALRKLWNGEKVTVSNELFDIQGYSLRSSNNLNIPIFLGVRGPQMLRLAGKIADGVILSGPIDYLQYAIERVNKAAKDNGRRPDEIEKLVWLPTIPTFKGGNEKLAKRVVAVVAADMPQTVLDMLSIDREKLDALVNAVASSGAQDATEYVDEEIMNMFAITGTKAQMIEIFSSIAKLGANEILVGPPFSGNWRTALEEIFAEIE